MTSGAQRFIAVPGLHNLRDLGPLGRDTCVTRPGVLLRSEAPVTLGVGGRQALLELGVRTAIDLREPAERALNPPDLGVAGIEVHSVPIFSGAFNVSATDTLDELYSSTLAHCGARLGAAVAILAEPDALPAMVFCSVGKDRTGLLCALLLSAVGVDDAAIAEDYALTMSVMHGEF
jgi:protein-tyrosine phosphatase